MCVCVWGGGGGGRERGVDQRIGLGSIQSRASVSYAKKIREGDPADLLRLLCCAEN